MAVKWDFGGWATKNDFKCADGRTIRKNAFKECDGKTVPLVWQHMHDGPENVLGHVLLQNEDEGVYAFGKFNNTERGQYAKELVQHGDIDALSIYANQLKQSGGDVLHGVIREVSLVLAGANPGALIDFPILAHGEESTDEAVIYFDQGIDAEEYLEHSAKKTKKDRTIREIFETLDDEQKNAVYAMLGMVAAGIDESKGNNVKHSADDDGEEDESMGNTEMSIEDVIDTMTDDQKEALYAMMDAAADDALDQYEDALADELDNDDYDDDYEDDGDYDDGDDVEHGYYDDDYYEGDDMKYNVFEQDYGYDDGDYLAHSITDEDYAAIFSDAKRLGSLKEAVEAHMEDGVLAHAVPTTGMTVGTGTQTYGFRDPDMLFPDYKALSDRPEFIRIKNDWVGIIMNGVHHTPFTRIKSVFADITEDEARAKGYIKGKLKKEEFFKLLKRTTDPQTVYKKQKMDRDDAIDITDFDVVAWIKAEMREKLDEEIARAILIGDGRASTSEEKISADHVRPIAHDVDLFTIKVPVNPGADENELAKNFIRAAIKARKDYRGTGSPILFTTADMLANMQLLTDTTGRDLYPSEQAVATKLRVSRMVEVEYMETAKDAQNRDILGIIVNPADYNVGADKGGSINMFEDFDIDYNQQKYLIETRISGALIKPYSAIVIYKAAAASGNEGSGE